MTQHYELALYGVMRQVLTNLSAIIGHMVKNAGYVIPYSCLVLFPDLDHPVKKSGLVWNVG